MMALKNAAPGAALSLRHSLEEMVELDYQVCTHCGFRLMHVLPPTRKTFPLPVLYCPVCGLRQDDNGFTPGRKLSQEEKLEALKRWLQEQGLDEETLREEYHLNLERFFDPRIGH